MMVTNSFADEVVGSWCDRAVPTMPELDYVMTISRTDDGKFRLQSERQDGSSGYTDLEEINSGYYRDPASSTGDNLRIDSGEGELILADNYGVIRTALPISGTDEIEACLKGVRP